MVKVPSGVASSSSEYVLNKVHSPSLATGEGFELFDDVMNPNDGTRRILEFGCTNLESGQRKSLLILLSNTKEDQKTKR